MHHSQGAVRYGRTVARRRLVVLVLLFATLLLSLTSTASGQAENQFTQIEMLLLRDPTGAAQLPIEVRVQSQRAVEGTLEVRSADQNLVLQFPLAMAANSELSQLVSVPAGDDGALRSLTASLLVDGEAIDEAELQNIEGANNFAAGVLGLDVQQGNALLEPAIGTTSLIEVNDIRLLPALDIFVISSQGFESLTPTEQSQLLTWTGAGGQLAVADDPGTLDDLLPAAWQSSGVHELAGSGEISYIGTAWVDSIPPPTATAVDADRFRFNTGPDDLIEDGRFRIPSLRILVLIVAVYVVVVGPITIWYLNKMERPRLAWLAIPSLALFFSLAVIIAGSISNDRRTDAYVSIVTVTPAGAEVTNTVLVTSTGTERFELASGWTLLTNGSDSGAVGAGSELTVAHARNSSELTFQIETGSAGVAKLRGYVPDVDLPFSFDQVIVLDGAVRGVLSNDSDVALDDVVVLVDGAMGVIGRIEPGATEPFTLALAEGEGQGFAPELDLWNPELALAFGDPVVDQNEDSVNTAAWLSWRLENFGASVPSGVLTVVGWSRELEEYSLVSGSGRTALVQHQALPEPTDEATTAYVRTQQPLLVTDIDAVLPVTEANAATTFVRPPGTSGDGLALSVPLSTEAAALWVGGEWRYLLLSDDAPVISIPEDAWENDRLTLLLSDGRVATDLDQARQRLVVRFPNTAPGLLAASGRVPQRQRLFSDFDLELELPPSTDLDGASTEEPDEPDETAEAAQPDVGANSAEADQADENIPRHRTSFGRPSRSNWARFDTGSLEQSYDSYSTLLEPGDMVTIEMESTLGISYLQVVGPRGEVVAHNRVEVTAGEVSPLSFEAEVWGVYEMEVRLLDDATADTYSIDMQSLYAETEQFVWTIDLVGQLVQRRVRFSEGDEVSYLIESDDEIEVTVFDPDWNPIVFERGTGSLTSRFVAEDIGEYTVQVASITNSDDPISQLTLALGGELR